jgi:hypothetical protein
MAHFKVHCEDCVKELGKPYEEVHKWLDEFVEAYGGMSHRRARHHKKGVEEVRAMWGDEAAKAAEIHILRDLWFWGEVPDQDEYDDVELAYYSAAKNMFH